ncbi:MAG: ComEC/Rec2 family competence protein [Bacteroidia bacterium]|nr:ComEC family competence protein [Bacteroidia bacterium]MDW8014994.1 ComEC/Rec2 family competence protein [Bacteroidia bacterium]
MPAWRYPLLWAGGAFVGGILLNDLPLLGAVALLSGGSGLAAYFWFLLKWGRIVWSLPLFGIAGWIRGWSERLPYPHEVSQFYSSLVQAVGYISEEPLRSRHTIRLIVEADSIYLYRTRQDFHVTGKILVYVRDSSALHLPAGTRVRMILRLDSVKFAQTYWKQQGVRVSGFTERITSLGIETGYWRGYFQRWRQSLIQLMQEKAPAGGAPFSLIQALLLGYKRGIDPEVREAFQLSGAAHILAVSGMHVGLVLSLWLFLLGRLPGKWRHHWISQSMLMGLILFYGFLTGGAPSAMRAVIMGIFAILSRMLYKPYFPLNALGGAAFIQSAIDPFVIYQAGFQLSYAAVGGIMAFHAPLRHFLSSIVQGEKLLQRYLKDLLSISIAAQAGTFFLSWAYFGRFPIYFLLTNLFAVPLATGVTFSAVGWLMLLPFPFVGQAAAYPVYGIAWLLIKGIQLVAHMPGAALYLPPLPLWMGIGLTLIIIVGGRVAFRHSLQAWLI